MSLAGLGMTLRDAVVTSDQSESRSSEYQDPNPSEYQNQIEYQITSEYQQYVITVR